jgi:hypothetical protein
MDFQKITYPEIEEWCIKNNQVEWLKEEAKKPYYNKETGEARDITFVDLKLAFFYKFFPEKAPKRKEKQPTIWERIAAL